jgi:hypothetical protein
MKTRKCKIESRNSALPSSRVYDSAKRHMHRLLNGEMRRQVWSWLPFEGGGRVGDKKTFHSMVASKLLWMAELEIGATVQYFVKSKSFCNSPLRFTKAKRWVYGIVGTICC